MRVKDMIEKLEKFDPELEMIAFDSIAGQYVEIDEPLEIERQPDDLWRFRPFDGTKYVVLY